MYGVKVIENQTNKSFRRNRDESYKQAFPDVGATPQKHFANAMTRYGIRGYRLSQRLGEGLACDFWFPLPRKLAVFVGRDISETQRNSLEGSGIEALVVPEELGMEWFLAIARILGQDPGDVSPLRPNMFPRMEEFE